MAGVAAAALVIFLVALVPAASGTDYTVGGSQGWASGVDYNAWANGKTFILGDTLLFQYSVLHDVAEVGEADYKTCSASNSIQTNSDQSTKITLTKPGSRYFICGTPGHCSSGMKLSVSVAASSSTTPAAGSPPSTPSESSPPTEPSSDTPSSTKSSTTNTSSGGRSSGFHTGNALFLAALLLLGLGLVG